MKEHLSALIDGELEPARFDQVLAQLHADPALRDDWQDWHLVGDVMQQHPILSPDFMKTFCDRLAAEPVVFAPAASSRRRRFMRRALAPLSAAASVAFLSVVGWQAFHGAYTGSAVAVPHMAAMATPQAVHVANSDSKFRAYLAAHHEDSGNPIDGRDLVYASFETKQPTK
ncbi:sigma-E factor negative regulatory protein [Silvimonas sp.]|uniref:sigma-E factor negative regulatory protein n=1 Tax=Silvimonas sp. TaxID=2650811 RepID=UPI00284993D3|nr:sigma-E factor negative regulatory protein [Silvimonas sp.]MDR3428326.1 sigma-E factor negative regulatory protein [Silvimonas sp.]